MIQRQQVHFKYEAECMMPSRHVSPRLWLNHPRIATSASTPCKATSRWSTPLQLQPQINLSKQPPIIKPPSKIYPIDRSPWFRNLRDYLPGAQHPQQESFRISGTSSPDCNHGEAASPRTRTMRNGGRPFAPCTRTWASWCTRASARSRLTGSATC